MIKDILDSRPNAPREHPQLITVFFVPGHGITEAGDEQGFQELRKGLLKARLGMTTVEWVNGPNTTPDDQVEHLDRVIGAWHSRQPFRPFALASHSRGSTPLLREARKIIQDPDISDRLTGAILLSPAPYDGPVFPSFKAHRDLYPSDYATFPDELRDALENSVLPELSDDLPIEIFSGKDETPYNHQMEGALLYKYRGAKYHQVPTTKLYHPTFGEYADTIGKYAGSVSRIYGEDFLLSPPLEQLKRMQLSWTDTPGFQFARLPRGRVAMRSRETGHVVDLSPGAWVNFMGGALKGDFDDIGEAS